MRLKVVMVNYRTPADAIKFLHSFQEFAPSYCDLVTVDVHPNEFSEEFTQLATRLGYLRITDSNVGYAKACNLEVKMSPDHDAYAFFNADVRILPGSIDSCVDLLFSDDSYGVVGPKQVNTLNRVTHAGIVGTNEAPRIRGWREVDTGQYDDIVTDCVSVSGSAYFVRGTVWWELATDPTYVALMGRQGAFLPTPHYYEETFLSYFARHKGYKVVYNGEAKMIHEWHKASPLGGTADRQMPVSRQMFRDTCDALGITHD
jgi:GT2 family glycosyltransferase